jgi:hypothetical protein
MLSILFDISVAFGIFFLLLGIFITWHIVRLKKYPTGQTSRIDKICLLWFVLTQEDKLVKNFPWLMNDEFENVNSQPTERESYGLSKSFSTEHFNSGTPIILVENEFDRDQVISALKYLHDSSDIDTDFTMVNTLVHLYKNPDLIKIREPNIN